MQQIKIKGLLISTIANAFHVPAKHFTFCANFILILDLIFTSPQQCIDKEISYIRVTNLLLLIALFFASLHGNFNNLLS